MTRKLTKQDVSWKLDCLGEDAPVRGNAMASGDDKVDKRVENRILRQLENGNQWAWCYVILRGTFKGLEATDSLGRCSYRNEKDFVKNSGYYDDMVNVVLGELQEAYDKLLAFEQEEVVPL